MPRWKPGSLRPTWEKALARSAASVAATLFDPALFWQTWGTYEGEPIRFDDWQVAHLRDYSRYRAREKAPQLGFSWLSAAEATWDCLLHLDATNGFVSVDQREASEKVLYARKLYDGLDDRIKSWVPLLKDSTEELWFGQPARPSRLMSIPATSALRGRRMSVYLDEVDFYKDGGRDAFRIAHGRVQRGGRVTLGSTCFGVDTQLDNVMSGEDRNYSRARLPYQVAENPEVQEAIMIAKQELNPDDFAEEYECVRGGGMADTFPAELIRRAQHEQGTLDSDSLEGGGANIVFGYDVAATRHPPVLTGLEGLGSTWLQMILTEVRDKSLPEQQTFLDELLTRLPLARLVIDAGGLGRQITQALQAKFGDFAEGGRVLAMIVGSKPPDLPPMDKSEMTVELRRALEADELKLASDRDQALQFRRTKRLPGGRVDQPGSKKRTHYDKYWATGYAWYGVKALGGTASVYESRGLLVVSR